MSDPNAQLGPIEQFEAERKADIATMGADEELRRLSLEWMIRSDKYKYTYNFSWLGRPIIKFPSDIVAMQELIWQVQPDLIIETGIAHGGSIIFSASMLELIGKGEVLGIDIDIREHNREKIEAHPMYKRVRMIQGSSVAEEVVEQARQAAAGKKNVMVVLDSLHTHDHVLQELNLYAPLVTKGSYLILPDTFIEHFPAGYYEDRPWDVGNNPMTALREWQKTNDDFVVDESFDNKLMISEAINGYLKRVK